LNKLGKVLFWLWACLFVAGASAQLLGLDWLSELTDVKRIFLH